MTWQAVAGAEGLDGSVIRPGEQDETLNNIRTDPPRCAEAAAAPPRNGHTSAFLSQSRTGGRRAPTLPPHLVNVVVSTPFSPAKTLLWRTAWVRGRSSPSASAVACDTVTTASAAIVTRQGRGEEAEKD